MVAQLLLNSSKTVVRLRFCFKNFRVYSVGSEQKLEECKDDSADISEKETTKLSGLEKFCREDLARHAKGWSAEYFEAQVRSLLGDNADLGWHTLLGPA